MKTETEEFTGYKISVEELENIKIKDFPLTMQVGEETYYLRDNCFNVECDSIDVDFSDEVESTRFAANHPELIIFQTSYTKLKREGKFVLKYSF